MEKFTDTNKQMLVKGVDYIQGFYTGRPALEVVEEIAEDIKKEICETFQRTRNM